MNKEDNKFNVLIQRVKNASEFAHGCATVLDNDTCKSSANAFHNIHAGLEIALRTYFAEEIEQLNKPEEPEEPLFTSLDVLELPHKLIDSLMDEGISSIEDLKRLDWYRLMKVRNFGSKSIQKLRNALDKINITLPEK